MGRRLGLIVGINNYQDAAFCPLQFAEMDARALAQWLVNARGGKWASADVQLLPGAQVTRQLFEAMVKQLCTSIAGPGDEVFVYFAGHAFLDEVNGEGYLALADTQYQTPATGVHLPTLASQAMSRSQAAHIVFIFDYFQTGRVWSMRRASLYDSQPLPGRALINTLQQVGNRILLCSCRGNELAPERGEQNLGILVHRMILGLCGPASDPATGQVTLQQLYAFLGSSLDEQHKPQRFGQERTPCILVGDLPATPQASLATGTGDLPSAPPNTRPITRELLAQQAHTASGIAQLSPQRPSNGTGPLGVPSEQQRHQQSMLLLQQARYFVQMQQPNEALNLIEQALLALPTNSAALILKGQLLGTLGRFSEAMVAVEQLLQQDPNNALGWSMRAALLANLGQYAEALPAVDRALALDPNNTETQAIKTTIMVKLAVAQTPGSSSNISKRLTDDTPPPKRGGAASFMIGAAVQFLSLTLGIVGAGLAILRPGLPGALSLALESVALALLCVNAARGAYLYGVTRFLLTILTSAIPAAILVVALVPRSNLARVFQVIKDHPTLLVPMSFLILWLALAAILPLVVGFGGWISGAIRSLRRR